MTKHIPGNPKVIVQSMPGAGGIKMTNFAAQVMPRQGFNIFIPPDMSVVSQLMRPDKVKYDAREFTWLGSSNQTNSILVVRTDSGVKNWADYQRTQVIMGHTGPGSTSYVNYGLEEASRRGAQLLVIRLDTPGGLVSSTRALVKAIFASEIPVAVFVRPWGYQAWRPLRMEPTKDPCQ